MILAFRMLSTPMSLDLLKTIPQYLIPKHRLTTFAGWLASSKNSRLKNYIIQRFIRKYQVNMNEALIEDPTAYSCFNDFFVRHLKPGCRPLESVELVSPVDGCVSEIGRINAGQLIQAKGRYYSVAELLACTEDTAEQFSKGKFVTLYLSPKDYHRVHLPLDATLLSMTYIPGALFSVQPTTARVVPKLFARNERLVISFSTQIGPMMMVLVGATVVGAIGTSWHGDITRSKKNTQYDYEPELMYKGDEVGYFKLGSTVILIFANGNKVAWNKQLAAGSCIRFGQKLGEFTKD